MKVMKKILCLLFSLAMVFGLATTAFADGNTITYNDAGKLVDSYSGENSFSGMLPGQTRSFSIDVVNSSSKSTDWYMANSVLDTLEDAADRFNGAYEYKLTYTDAAGVTKSLYDSETVGGQNTMGLDTINDSALVDYFYIDTLDAGKTAKVTLTVTLDGETQNNNYANTDAEIEIDFAVEETITGTVTHKTVTVTNTVQTGDNSNLVLPAVLMGVAALILIAVAVSSIRKNKKGGRA